MKSSLRTFSAVSYAAVLTLMLVGCQSAPPREKAETSPNIIYILADDLGYGELGSYGQQLIETPHLDALAASGMKFLQHYSGSPVCAPSRCVLLTGKHSGHAYIRGNDEWRSRGEVWDYEAMFADPNLEGQRPLPVDSVTIADLLRPAGYRNAIVGKWGLGGPMTEGVPNNQGFDLFYGYNCQRQAHTFYPKHLWKNRERVLLENETVAPHTNLAEGADPNDAASYAPFRLREYSAALMQEEALRFIEEQQDGPFFLYYASPIPHVPLQAPEKWVRYYQDKFGPEEPYTGKSYFPNQTPRATYAAMISYLDEQVGEIVQTLKDLQLYDNTIIFFSSDNGPTYTGGAQTEHFASARPFECTYGRGKGFVHEGGIRVPMIASWPGVIAPGSTTDHISAFWDVLPTMCEITGVAIPSHTDGISFLPVLLGNEDQQARHDYLYWEFPAYKGQQAVRMGNWKGIRKNIFDGNLSLELYDLSTDLLEERDVAEENPEIVRQLESIMQSARKSPELERFKFAELGDE